MKEQARTRIKSAKAEWHEDKVALKTRRVQREKQEENEGMIDESYQVKTQFEVKQTDYAHVCL